ncbi:carboxymuconolactone decarboxylase family protein [Paludifilum halophilum]|uniref:carboxymuconolactone decarboxylase family protein n=1 Tax=Paludifilum halophilum TaxID=1642702 RepID=UPI001F0A7505|nr:carboxymuconolactone decarboxylase family protein [Paludifilum halophilum]
MSRNLYTRDHLEHLNRIGKITPELQQAFQAFNRSVMKEGALTVKEKEIIAVAVAHATECPYCIDIHTKQAKKAGASLKELVEAAFVTASIEGGGAIAHSTHVKNALDPEGDDILYRRSNLSRMDHIKPLAPEAFDGAMSFFHTAGGEGTLSAKLKELIAVAVAHTTECPYCIDLHTQSADKAGASEKELAEAILVASALRAGGAYAHIANMIASYDEDEA